MDVCECRGVKVSVEVKSKKYYYYTSSQSKSVKAGPENFLPKNTHRRLHPFSHTHHLSRIQANFKPVSRPRLYDRIEYHRSTTTYLPYRWEVFESPKKARR